MNKHIEQFKTYINTNEQPLLQTSFFKLCKEMYETQGMEIKMSIHKLAESINGKKTITKESIKSVIEQIGTSNRGRQVSIFVFAVTADVLYEVDWKVSDVLPPNIDYEVEILKKSDHTILKSGLLGLAVGILLSW